jgi:hypothetical protein
MPPDKRWGCDAINFEAEGNASAHQQQHYRLEHTRETKVTNHERRQLSEIHGPLDRQSLPWLQHF